MATMHDSIVLLGVGPLGIAVLEGVAPLWSHPNVLTVAVDASFLPLSQALVENKLYISPETLANPAGVVADKRIDASGAGIARLRDVLSRCQTAILVCHLGERQTIRVVDYVCSSLLSHAAGCVLSFVVLPPRTAPDCSRAESVRVAATIAGISRRILELRTDLVRRVSGLRPGDSDVFPHLKQFLHQGVQMTLEVLVGQTKGVVSSTERIVEALLHSGPLYTALGSGSTARSSMRDAFATVMIPGTAMENMRGAVVKISREHELPRERQDWLKKELEKLVDPAVPLHLSFTVDPALPGKTITRVLVLA